MNLQSIVSAVLGLDNNLRRVAETQLEEIKKRSLDQYVECLFYGLLDKPENNDAVSLFVCLFVCYCRHHLLNQLIG